MIAVLFLATLTVSAYLWHRRHLVRAARDVYRFDRRMRKHKQLTR